MLFVRLCCVLHRVQGQNALPAVGMLWVRPDHKIVAVAEDPRGYAAGVVHAGGRRHCGRRIADNAPNVVAVHVCCVGLHVRRCSGLDLARRRVGGSLSVLCAKEVVVPLQLYLKGSVGATVDEGERVSFGMRKRFNLFGMRLLFGGARVAARPRGALGRARNRAGGHRAVRLDRLESCHQSRLY